jgi:hypothetical protein
VKFKKQGETAMVLGIFIGGIFLGFSLGFATMAMYAARGPRAQREEAPAIGDNLVCAYSPIRKFRPVRLARPQTSRAFFIPGP